jgi:hypothetical protein
MSRKPSFSLNANLKSSNLRDGSSQINNGHNNSSSAGLAQSSSPSRPQALNSSSSRSSHQLPSFPLRMDNASPNMKYLPPPSSSHTPLHQQHHTTTVNSSQGHPPLPYPQSMLSSRSDPQSQSSTFDQYSGSSSTHRSSHPFVDPTSSSPLNTPYQSQPKSDVHPAAPSQSQAYTQEIREPPRSDPTQPLSGFSTNGHTAGSGQPDTAALGTDAGPESLFAASPEEWDDLDDNGRLSPPPSLLGGGAAASMKNEKERKPVATRRRVVQSCSECRRRKIKCDKK